jgi:hypothetical protein
MQARRPTIGIEVDRNEGIREVGGPSHIVILGAGASIASTIYAPEPSGKKLPSMDNLIEVVGLADIIRRVDPGAVSKNFEEVYSSLWLQDPHSSAIKAIEFRVRDYFGSLRLPPTPTIYDYLVLSLRPKDLVVTFNWDPFLYQAFSRNRHVCGMPCLSFLHGSVSVGFSSQDRKAGPAGWFSKKTGSEFVPTRLLYPVTVKDYNADEFTRREWDRLRRWLKHARRITIFGYGAPSTDVEAVKLMSEAWGDPQQRNLEQIEIIDVQPQEVVRERWGRFIHTHHYDYCASYFDSVLAYFPRRSGENFTHRFLPSTPDEAFQEPNTVPKRFGSLEEMWEWYQPLFNAEYEAEPS